VWPLLLPLPEVLLVLVTLLMLACCQRRHLLAQAAQVWMAL
jgi:hypothetical protein